jgi:hypothetical protein
MLSSPEMKNAVRNGYRRDENALAEQERYAKQNRMPKSGIVVSLICAHTVRPELYTYVPPDGSGQQLSLNCVATDRGCASSPRGGQAR